MTLLEQYAEVIHKEKELAAEKKELNAALLDHMITTQTGKVQTDYGTLSLVQKLKYTYSDKIKKVETELKAQIKEMKKEEEPTLKPELVQTIMFRAK